MAMSEIEVPLFTGTIAGIQFRGKEAREELTQIESGMELVLEPEPDNKYDSNAIKIVSPPRAEPCPDNPDTGGGIVLGYVPRAVNKDVLFFMQQPRRVECRLMERSCDLINIVGFEPEGDDS
jgi:hypothetical protein